MKNHVQKLGNPSPNGGDGPLPFERQLIWSANQAFQWSTN
jgi:hypothetical protein